jgi:hypothetical protein
VVTAALLARFIFSLGGAPAGTVELGLDHGTYTYRSVHVFRRTKAERVETYAADAKPLPEGLWLWMQPAPGCVEGISELSHETGQLCVDHVKGHEVDGTSLGKPFTAKYDDNGELLQLRFNKSVFTRTDAPLKPRQPYAAGFPTEGKGTRLTLEPPVEGARWPELEPRGVRTQPAEEGSCLVLAQQYVEVQDLGGVLSLGLVVEKGRAYPHAWAGDVDPSAKLTDARRPNRAYLELPSDQAGALYVELLEGKRKLVWK